MASGSKIPRLDDERDRDSDDDSSFGSPEKHQRNAGGHFSTPEKKKLKFNFWAPETYDTNPVTSDSLIPENKRETISKLHVGMYAGKELLFRVVVKSPRRETKNGNIFSFHAMDATGQIMFTVFPDNFQKTFDFIEVNGVYKLENFSVREDSKTFPSLTGHTCQATLTTTSVLEKLREEDTGIPKIPFNFVSVGDIQIMDVGSSADILGILVRNCGVEITSVKGSTKRDVFLTDKSKKTVQVTLWGNAAREFEVKEWEVVAIRNGNVAEFQGMKSLNVFSNTLLWPGPELEAANQLRKWFHSEPKPKVANV